MSDMISFVKATALKKRYSICISSGDSGVDSFAIGDTYITVWFKGTSRSYTYSYGVVSSQHVENMKRLTQAGNGLTAYINHYVKFKYDR